LVSLFCLILPIFSIISLIKCSTSCHTTIPIAEYHNLPSYVLEFKEHCNEHHEHFSLYCKAKLLMV
jgi:hypothetical protein